MTLTLRKTHPFDVDREQQNPFVYLDTTSVLLGVQ